MANALAQFERTESTRSATPIHDRHMSTRFWERGGGGGVCMAHIDTRILLEAPFRV